MSWLVDTDVLSERTKAMPNPKVLDWMRDNSANIYTSSHVIAEIAAGIERLDGQRKTTLQEWLQRLVKSLVNKKPNTRGLVA